MMGRSNTHKYQVGRAYIINDVFYNVIASSTKRENMVEKAKEWDYPIIKKDESVYALLVPTGYSLNAKDFSKAMRDHRFDKNHIKLKGD